MLKNFTTLSYLSKEKNITVWKVSKYLPSKTNHIDIALTGTDYCNSKAFSKIEIHFLFLIFQKNLPQNHSPNVVFWNDLALASKFAYGKFKSNPNPPFSFLKKRHRLDFSEKRWILKLTSNLGDGLIDTTSDFFKMASTDGYFLYKGDIDAFITTTDR